MAEQFDEFIEELERDIRQERFLKIWNSHGKKIIAGVITVVTILGFYTLWQNYETGQRLRLAQKFIGAQELASSGKQEQAVSVLRELVKEARGAYLIQTQFMLAALLGQEGPQQNLAEAVKLYESLATQKGVKPVLRDFAVLMNISKRAAQKEDIKPLLEGLKPLLDKSNSWYFQAKELEAVFLAQVGEKLKAAEIFSDIIREGNVPEGAAMRAQMMGQMLLNEIQTKE